MPLEPRTNSSCSGITNDPPEEYESGKSFASVRVMVSIVGPGFGQRPARLHPTDRSNVAASPARERIADLVGEGRPQFRLAPVGLLGNQGKEVRGHHADHGIGSAIESD